MLAKIGSIAAVAPVGELGDRLRAFRRCRATAHAHSIAVDPDTRHRPAGHAVAAAHGDTAALAD
jgi:hypothetical protein